MIYRCFIAIALLLASVGTNAQQRIALVIGNANYQSGGFDPLTGPRNDAPDVEAALRELQFRIMPGPAGKVGNRDLSKRQLRDQLQAFAAAARGADVALLYFAGHGAAVAGENYLLPVDIAGNTTVDVMQDGTSLSATLATLKGSANSIIVVFDACRDTPNARGLVGGPAAISTQEDFLIAFSTAEKSTAQDLGPNRRNSPYTEAFLAELKRNPQRDMEIFFRDVRVAVRQQTGHAQLPELWIGLDRSVQFGIGAPAPIANAPTVVEAPATPSFPGSQQVASIEINGLTWTRSDNGKDVSWHDAKRFCTDIGTGWGLPTLKELATLYDSSGRNAVTWVASWGSEFEIKPISPELILSTPFFWSDTLNDYGSDFMAVAQFDGEFFTEKGLPKNGTRRDTSENMRALCVRRF